MLYKFPHLSTCLPDNLLRAQRRAHNCRSMGDRPARFWSRDPGLGGFAGGVIVCPQRRFSEDVSSSRLYLEREDVGARGLCAAWQIASVAGDDSVYVVIFARQWEVGVRVRAGSSGHDIVGD
jgi:hypothetical protein